MTVQTMLSLLLQGFLTTLAIFTLTLLGSLPLGLLVYFGKKSRIAPLRWLVNAYISIMRGTPLMLQLMVVYFGPNLLFGLSVSGNWRFTAVVLGYTKTQTFMKIILPQMVKRVMPSVTNEVITLVKDTSLAYVIGVVEMFTRAKQINSAPGGMGLWAFLAAGVIYYVFNFIVTVVMDQVEKKMSYYQ